MIYNKKSFLVYSLVSFIIVASVSPAQAVCLVNPTMCPVEMCGYQTQESPSAQMMQKVTTGYKTAKKEIKSIRKSVSGIMKSVTALPGIVTGLVAQAVSLPFEAVGSMLGLTEGKKTQAEDDPNNVTQYNTHGMQTVQTRIDKNLKTYNTEANSDYESQYFNLARRQFIRQQATITLMARVAVLKSYFNDIHKAMEEADKEIEKLSAQSSGDANNSYNEAAIGKMNLALKQAWFNLLTIQKQVEAVKLEFASNQAIAGMKMAKKVPTVSGNKNSSNQSKK